MLNLLTFVVSAENHPDLLARTVLLFHRLAIPIHALNMRRSDDSHLRIAVKVLAAADQSDRIATSLAKMVHVISIEARRRDEKLIRKPRNALAGKL
jgi:hypothetical protein